VSGRKEDSKISSACQFDFRNMKNQVFSVCGIDVNYIDANLSPFITENVTEFA